MLLIYMHMYSPYNQTLYIYKKAYTYVYILYIHICF